MLAITFDKLFTLNEDSHKHNTRSSNKIHINYVRTNYNKNLTKYKESQIWNSFE